MLYYRMMRKNESNMVMPVVKNHSTIDLVYSNEMPSRALFSEERKIWSLSKTPEAALKWSRSRGKGLYDRLAVFDFQGDEGELYDLTEFKTWIGLIHQSNSSNSITNLNGNKKLSLDAIRSVIPCMKGAWSMAKECEEVVFIPSKQIKFIIVDDLSQIPKNPAGSKSVLTELNYDNTTIDSLLNQLDKYDIGRKELVRGWLTELKVV